MYMYITKILTPEELRARATASSRREGAGSASGEIRFTCFTGTKVQILTPEALGEPLVASDYLRAPRVGLGS